MLVRITKSIAVLFLALALFARAASAVQQSSLSLTATPDYIAADGKSTTTITAFVRDGSGSLAPDGSTVQFQPPNLGTLSSLTSTTSAGQARVTLTSSSTAGTSKVTATYLDTTSGGGVGQGAVSVEFTSDKDLASTDGNSRWLRIDCSEYLVYSADGKIVQAESGTEPAHLHFKALTIDAKSIQVDLQTMQVIARDATLHCGKASLVTAQLAYDLYTFTGTAVLPGTDTKGPQPVTVTGSKFDTMPLPQLAAEQAVHTNVYGETDLSTSRLVVSARAIAVDPGIQVQFTRATIYSDGKKVVSMPFHVMPLTTNQLFGEQIVGYSSEGIFLNIPYYYHVTPDSMGTIYVRNSAAATAGIASGLAPTFGDTGARPGLAVDLQQTYTAGSAGSGAVILNSLTRSDWGASWNDTQRIDPVTNSYFYIDYPAHRDIYGTSSIRRQLAGGYLLGVSANETVNPPFDGYSSNSSLMNAYVASPGKRIGSTPFTVNTDFTWNQGFINEQSPTVPKIVQPVSTQGADLRFAVPSLHPNKATVVTNSLAIGASHSLLTGQSSYTLQGALGATNHFAHQGTLALNYNYTYDPLLNYVTAPSPYSNYLNSPLQQTLSLTGSIVPSKKSVFTVSTNYGLPSQQLTAFAFYNYNVNNEWEFGIDSLFQHTIISSFSTLEISVTRRIFGRSLIFTYGTDTHRIQFNFGAGQF